MTICVSMVTGGHGEHARVPGRRETQVGGQGRKDAGRAREGEEVNKVTVPVELRSAGSLRPHGVS